MIKLTPYILSLAFVLGYAPGITAEELKPSAYCNAWSANYWGNARVTSQAEADEFACFRRVVGNLTIVQASAAPLVMPQLRGVVGDLHIVFASNHDVRDPRSALAQMLPLLEGVTGHVTIEYIRGAALLPLAAAQISDLEIAPNFAELGRKHARVTTPESRRRSKLA